MDRNLSSSANYIWNTSIHLGKGATCSVYQGMNKHTGELVAVKVFNNNAYSRPQHVQRREYEVLTKINHENIVKLLAIEDETENKLHKVIIMELCTGGSLFVMLDDPKNSFGLEETEFLLVLKHLTAGIKYLRDINIVHRDLKPGNIMKHITEDGQSIYKLTDFGAARELEEDQNFHSLHGTEEYLHPELYEQAVLKRNAVKPFSAKVDLWSIGVTLYHLATGVLPFRPYGGSRKNCTMMYKIITAKQPGFISGVQHTEDGDIEWSDSLPKSCLLSPSLQPLISSILGGLLEANPENMWTFDRFFQAVLHTLNHKPVHVFCLNNVTHHTFYISANEKISYLKTCLVKATQIPIKNQLLIWDKREIFDNNQMIFSPKDNPIYLVDTQATSIKSNNPIIPSQYKFPEILNVVVSSNDRQYDSQQIKACSSIAYCISRATNKCLACCESINQVPQQILSKIDINVKLLNEKRDACSHSIRFLKDQIEFSAETMSNLYQCNKLTEPSTPYILEINRLREDFSRELDLAWKDLLPKIINITERVENLKTRWNDEQQSSLLKNMKSSKARVDFLCAAIKDSWIFMHKSRSYRSLGGNESQRQHLEKVRIDTNCKKLLRIINEQCHQNHMELVEKLDDWYGDAHVVLLQSGCLMGELSNLMEVRQRLQYRFESLVEIQHKNWSILKKNLNKLINEVNNSSEEKSQLQRPTQGNTIWNKLNNDAINMKIDLQKQARNIRSNSCTQVEQFNGCEQHSMPEHLEDEIRSLKDISDLLYKSLSENQNLFSEVVGIISPKTTNELDQY